MALFVFDTDILSLFQTGHAIVRQRVAGHSPEELATTIITVEEQLSSWYTLRRRVKDRDKLARVYERFAENVRFLSGLQILSFPESAITRFEGLVQMKLGVRANDLRIAAIALHSSATVVTRNRRDFERVPGVVVEDWSVLVE
jgi:tRNA(fMet)-specific endonuclease VapC